MSLCLASAIRLFLDEMLPGISPHPYRVYRQKQTSRTPLDPDLGIEVVGIA
jgi:hypothetical protein